MKALKNIFLVLLATAMVFSSCRQGLQGFSTRTFPQCQPAYIPEHFLSHNLKIRLVRIYKLKDFSQADILFFRAAFHIQPYQTRCS